MATPHGPRRTSNWSRGRIAPRRAPDGSRDIYQEMLKGYEKREE